MVPAHRFLQHLTLFARTDALLELASTSSLGVWRQMLAKAYPQQLKALEAAARTYAPEFEAAINALQTFDVEPQTAPLTLVPIVTDLIGRYRRDADSERWQPLLPLPDDERVPGWKFTLSEAAELLSVEPHEPFAALGKVSIHLDPSARGRFAASFRDTEASAVELAALRAMIRELMNPESEVGQRVTAMLAMPSWEKLLNRLAKHKPKPAFETGFQVSVAHGYIRVQALRRPEGEKAAWRRADLSAVLTSDEVSDLEREVATLATMMQARPAGRSGADGFLLLSRLAEHPHVFSDAAGKHLFRVVADDVQMRFDRKSESTVRATFVAGERTLDKAALTELVRAKFAVFEGEDEVIAARLPSDLGEWVSAALRTRDAVLEFPAVSQPRLRQALIPLRDAVHVADSVAEELYGREVPAAPRVGIALEWGPTTKITLLIEVAKGAPLIVAGEGYHKFSFTAEGEAHWTYRDLAREMALLEPVAEALAQFADFDGSHIGVTRGLPETLALASFVDENPLGLRIESRVGAPQKKVGWEELTSRVSIAGRGAWFAVKGSASLGGHTLPLGDLLAAIRNAQQFVAFGSAQHLEITDQLRKELLPLAMSATDDKGELLVHQAFARVLAQTKGLFREFEGGIDWQEALRKHKKNLKGKTPTIECGELRDYQEMGVRWMHDLARWAPGCVLADDMGLGKTVQTAAILLARRDEGPALVIAPASVTFNWKLELERFAPSLRVTQWSESRAFEPKAARESDVLVVSYGLLQRVPESFNRMWTTVVLDEVQFLKNHLAKRTAVIRDLPRAFTIALSGTPLENHLGELWSVMSLAFPGLLGSEATFRRRFREGAQADTLAALNTLLAPFLLRRTRKEVLDELPARQDIDLFVDLSEAESKKYEALRKACELQFVRKDERLTVAQHKIQMLAALTRLRQLACDVWLVDKTHEGESSKLIRLRELCEELRAQGAAVLIFSQFTQLLERARGVIEASGTSVGYLDGGTPIGERKRLVQAFQAAEFDAFFISLKAGGTGLNLTRASYVIHLDPWWNPAVEEQANSRAHRMGQRQSVTAYRLIARGTIEESILSLHAHKRELALSVLDGKSSATPMRTEDFVNLVRHQQVVSS